MEELVQLGGIAFDPHIRGALVAMTGVVVLCGSVYVTLWLGFFCDPSYLGVYPSLELPARAESDHPAGGHPNRLLGFWVTPWTLSLIVQIEITKPR